MHAVICIIVQSEVCTCVYAYVRMGEVACCEEIKAFIAKHSIKQQQIASLAGKYLPALCHNLCLFINLFIVYKTHHCS